jgi:signal transduction histidine kinase
VKSARLKISPALKSNAPRILRIVRVLATIMLSASVFGQELTTPNFASFETNARPSVRLELDSANAVLTSQFLAGTQMQVVKFDAPVTGRYFCLETLSAHDGRAYAAVAELDLLGAAGEVLNRDRWKIAYADSEESEREDGSAENAIDGDPRTIWHTQWSTAAPNHPHHLILDLGKSCVLGGFRYLPRAGNGNVGGRIKDYRIYVGDNLLEENQPERPLPEKFYLFGYFTGMGDAGLKFAYSLNGYHWDVLNHGNVVLKPQAGDKLMRDPRLLRGPDGTFHMVWTAGWTGNFIGYASSKDLIHWSEQETIPVMTNYPAALNCWAPEIFWNARKEEFLIFWASTVSANSSRTNLPGNHRIYCTTTKDFKKFSDAKLFYDPGFSVLNATIVSRTNRFYLIFKDDTQQRLRTAVADDPEGPFGAPGPLIENEGVEGPVCFRSGNQLFTLFNILSETRYGGVRTSDMEHWDDISPGIFLPPGSGQGSVLQLPGEMFKQFLNSGLLELGTTPAASELGLGDWIWTTNFADLQVCRLWRAFDIPQNTAVARAQLQMTADNSYTVYLDGRQIGRGGDANNLAEYDLTWLMTPGRHVLAVEAFNDTFDAGMILGLRVKLANGKKIEVFSDSSWRVVTTGRNWLTQKQPDSSWLPAQLVGYAGQMWWRQPGRIIQVPPLQPPLVHFWQQGWVLAVLLLVCLTVAVLWVRQGIKLALQARASHLLERERARIARDMHDDLGSGLTQLTLLGELVLREMPRDGETRQRLNDLCAKARSLLRSMDEIVWAVNPRRDTVKDFAAFISEFAQEFLAATSVRCRQEVAEELPDVRLELPQRRNLLLAVKEAIRNAARHSGADEVTLKVRVADNFLSVAVEDNGRGFSPADARETRNGLANMKQRLADIGGTFEMQSSPGKGCRVSFLLPLERSGEKISRKHS